MLENLLNLIYPPVCGICGKINENFLCMNCLIRLNEIRCDSIDTHLNSTYFDKHFYLFKYEGIVRKKIIDYKFNDCAYLYKTFEKILLNDKNVCEFIKSYDIILPVPIHKARKKERGYNQSALIVAKLIRDINFAYKTNVEFNDKILLKIKNTDKQSSLNKKEKIIYIKYFYCLKEKTLWTITNKKVLLFDDIYTTGSTVNECAKTLKQAKLKKVDVFTFAKD